MKILLVTLSNIGDCILTLPVLDRLREKYPQAKITCLVPARPKEIFINNPAVDSVIIFDKHARLKEKIKLFFSLSQEGFDRVVDLRNSFFGAFLPAKKRSAPLRLIPKRIKHMKDRHLFRANLSSASFKPKGFSSLIAAVSDQQFINGILSENKINRDKLIVISPGARSQTKRWDQQNFSQLCEILIQQGWQVVLAGDTADQPICGYIQEDCGGKTLDLSGKTTIGQLAVLLKEARLLITNDSAVMHLASYLDVPVVAIFGPTDEKKYGPWSQNCAVVKKDIFCRPCEQAQCRFGTLACLTCINPEDVFNQVKLLLCHCEEARQRRGDEAISIAKNKGDGSVFQSIEHEKRTVPGILYRRILIARTDRLGDVLLSTPVIKALRQKFPQAYISMLVSPYTKDVLDGNPALDEIITFDKDVKNKGWLAGLKFAMGLRKKKFDLAIVLHPVTRVHLLIFLAGIPKRLGYDRKFGFLFTHRIKHTKQCGQKHESEFALDLIRYLGIEPVDKTLFMPVKQESEKWVKVLFSQAGIKDSDKLLIIHPTASCPSRIWPAERFAEVADRLAQKYGFKVCIVSGLKDTQKVQEVIKNMRVQALNLAGKTSISQLASLLKRSQLFISTDSGPMHMASALGVPVITIFGRNQAGLSPRRWGPLGAKNRVLHKTVGCIICLAHNCQKDFACLKATTVKDVLGAAEEILK
ncbi:MAG: lipopolysaccharide heptosyltransferase II [Candidatus Omnitrophica bacterium]|nr:lipopolysaccharide heptosyltransferase II [Candidatus Omnitrophota bacterium]